jgi:TatD DNase family protein
MKPQLFDAHCHIGFPEFNADRNEVVKRAEELGIKIVNSSVSPEEVEPARDIAEEYDNVLWTLGLSASETSGVKVEQTLAAIRKYKNKIIGIGEVGLDYYWIKESKLQVQERENFSKFIELALEQNLPLVVHSRNAEIDCLNMLEKYGIPALMHCFSGTVEQAQRAVNLGCVISIPTNVAYSKQKQELARMLPLESIVLETDAPYLAPIPKTRNEPANVAQSVRKIAELRNMDAKDVAQATTGNAIRFFKLA